MANGRHGWCAYTLESVDFHVHAYVSMCEEIGCVLGASMGALMSWVFLVLSCFSIALHLGESKNKLG